MSFTRLKMDLKFSSLTFLSVILASLFILLSSSVFLVSAKTHLRFTKSNVGNSTATNETAVILHCPKLQIENILIKKLPYSLDNILWWKPPESFATKFPYYLSGFSKDGVPVWVVDWGEWDVRTLMAKGEHMVKKFDKYCVQMLYRWYSCYQARNEGRGENLKQETAFIVIYNCDGYDNRQFIHFPTVNKTLEMFRLFYQLEKTNGPALLNGYGVNVNFVATSLWHLIKPLLGEVASKVEIYGTKSARWKWKLMQDIPQDSLPPHLGGYQNYSPIMLNYY